MFIATASWKIHSSSSGATCSSFAAEKECCSIRQDCQEPPYAGSHVRWCGSRKGKPSRRPDWALSSFEFSYRHISFPRPELKVDSWPIIAEERKRHPLRPTLWKGCASAGQSPAAHAVIQSETYGIHPKGHGEDDPSGGSYHVAIFRWIRTETLNISQGLHCSPEGFNDVRMGGAALDVAQHWPIEEGLQVSWNILYHGCLFCPTSTISGASQPPKAPEL